MWGRGGGFTVGSQLMGLGAGSCPGYVGWGMVGWGMVGWVKKPSPSHGAAGSIELRASMNGTHEAGAQVSRESELSPSPSPCPSPSQQNDQDLFILPGPGSSLKLSPNTPTCSDSISGITASGIGSHPYLDGYAHLQTYFENHAHTQMVIIIILTDRLI